MSTDILTTKLHVPSSRPRLVRRDRLIERLNEGLHRKLTLISAPAGFGKTTLLSNWIESIERPIAWLSLDEGDSDPARFLAYLVAALQTVAPRLGDEVLSALRSPQAPPIESTVTRLLNEIAASPHIFVLVLDDYHLVDARPVDLALTFLLEHLPTRMHVAVATREDPQLPLARLRARGQLNELRAADLRFTPGEGAAFLNEVMGLSLPAADIAALEGRTEGWIVGLQLAALSMQGREDVSGFVRAFAGDNRYIVDYLVEEVLQRQPEPVRNFLLETAILERLNGSLCDAVTGQAGGSARLEALDRSNFFVVPLDDRRHWYRYHHLFGEVLLAHLMAERPGETPLLHGRASAWFERAGSLVDAVRHALAAEDYERAADLVERAVPTMRRHRQEAMLLDWLRALPDRVMHARPVLSVHYAGTLLQTGEVEGAEAKLRDAERWLNAAVGGRPEDAPDEMVVMDEEEFRGLPGSIAMYYAAIALAQGDLDGVMGHARRARDAAPEDDHLRRGSAMGLLGLAHWTGGNLEAAHDAWVDCISRLRKAGHLSDAIGASIALADIRLAQGRLREAMNTYELNLRLATEQGEPALRGTADMHVGLSGVHLERGDLHAAARHLLHSQELGEFAGLPQNRFRWCVAMARVRQAEGDADGTLELLNEAERLYVSDFFPNVRPVAAMRARAWVAQGRLGDALGWARDRGLSARDELSYLREFEHVTLARLLLARARSDRAGRHLAVEAMALLDRLLRAAEDGGRTGSVLEILVLQALTHQALGDAAAALVPLVRALRLGQPEGYVRVFADEGAPMAALLGEAAKQGVAPAYVRRLLGAPGQVEGRRLVEPVLSEPLSARERSVLRLLSSELDGPEIARELGVSLNTLRTHIKNIYAKLEVNNRRAAVRRAEQLDLL